MRIFNNKNKRISHGTLHHFGLLFLLMISSVYASVEDEQAAEIEHRIAQLKTAGHFPGVAVAIVKNGKPIYISTTGMANIEHNISVSNKSVFEMASLTKQMTALAIAKLVVEDEISFDMRLGDIISDIPAEWQAISINHLLSHTAGFEHHFEPMVNGSHLLENSSEDMFRAAKSLPLRSSPGEDWHYSDLGYFMLGKVIESITNTPYAKHMQETFFKPVGMAQTHLLDQNKIVPYRAQGYRWHNDQLERNRRVWNFELTPHFGVMSSLQDMLLWEQLLVNATGKLREAVEATVDIQRPFSTGKTCDTWGYARGWFASIVDGVRYVNHGGYAGTAYLRNVDRKLSVIVMTNREDGLDQINPIAIAWSVMNVMYPVTPKEGLQCWR